MKDCKTHIVISDSIDPSYNLSFEEWLLENAKEDTVIMYLWQNKNAIVIGRNQNPWKECRLDLMKKENVSLVRRLSGGGTVYHDIGNLNFTFIAHEGLYDTSRQTEVIVKALKGLGIETTYSKRNDLLARGRKFSGTAYVNKKGKSLHHGTLLVESNLELLERYLSAPKHKIESKGVDSVRSKVINLSEVNQDLTIDVLKEELSKSFKAEYSTDCTFDVYDESRIMEIVQRGRYNEWEWNYSESPSFSIQFENKFDWGNLTLDFKIKNGLIKECVFSSEELSRDELDKISEELIGTTFRGIAIVFKLDAMDLSPNVIRDIKEYIISII